MKASGKRLYVATVGIFWSIVAGAQTFSSIPREVPVRPDPTLTPGALCTEKKTVRYPEKILYCNRDVDSMVKDNVFYQYQQRYPLQKFNRHQFKMDHYIPLCMGGSNDPDNLWPQHLSISLFTDKIEDLLCKGMARGQLRQTQAVQLIRQAKADLATAQRMRQQLEQQYGP